MSSENHKKIPIPGGYVKRARCISNSEIAAAPPHFREIWELLVREANHQDATYRGFSIKTGQLFRSYDDIMESLHWKIGWRKVYYKKDQVKKAMKYLREHNMIETKKAPGGVLITICKYDFYQDGTNYQSTKENTNKAPSKHHQSSTNNNNDIPDNNYNNVNNSKKKYFFDLDNLEKLGEYEKLAYEFWKIITGNFEELKINLESLKKATFENWVNPIKQLLTTHNKTKAEINEVLEFFPTNAFWKKTLKHTNQLTKTNENGVLFFDSILIQKREADVQNSLPSIDELGIALRLCFPNPTEHFIKLFYQYQVMCKEAGLKIFKGKTLDVEINKLAYLSDYDIMAAVNILRKAISKKKEIFNGNNKKYYPRN